jgi:hypothetical protein
MQAWQRSAGKRRWCGEFETPPDELIRGYLMIFAGLNRDI